MAGLILTGGVEIPRDVMELESPSPVSQRASGGAVVLSVSVASKHTPSERDGPMLLITGTLSPRHVKPKSVHVSTFRTIGSL